MPAMSYIVSPEADFSAGIDVRSAENQIAPGFLRDLLNADIIEKRIRKRRGYQGFAGNLPVRVTKLEYDQANSMVCFTLDSVVSLNSTVNLEVVRSSPIVVYGRSSKFVSGDGPFYNVDQLKYYDKFSIPTRKTLVAPSGTLLIPGTEHDIASTSLFIGTVESTSTTDRSYQSFYLDRVRIDESSFDINLDYTTYIDRNIFVYFQDQSPVTGSSYTASITHSGSPLSQVFTISAATHSLANFNIIPQLQLDTGTEAVEVTPDLFLIHSNGDVEVTISNDTGRSQNYRLVLATAPIVNTVNGSVNASSSGQIVISQPTTPWIFPAIYLTSGTDRELVIPDSIIFDDAANTLTISFTNQAAVARNFTAFYSFGDLRSNQLCVTDNTVTTSGEDTAPQLTIWGLDHSEIYGSTKQFREGWSNHVDSYKRAGEQRLIAGLGGNLYSARTYQEVATQYGLPQLFPDLSSRTNTASIVGPAFWNTGDFPARTRGYLTGDNSATHWITASAVQYDSTNGWTKYTLEVPNKQILDNTGTATTLGAVISTTTGLEDWLTISDMSYARHSGTFKIRQVQDGTNQITLWVENDQNSSDYDDMNTGGQAAIFTDQLTWTATARYLPGDQVLSDILNDTTSYVCESSLGATTVISGAEELLQIAAGVLFTGARTGAVIPLRTAYPNAVPDATNLVRGDMLSYTGISRLLRVLYVNPDQDRTVNLTSDGSTAIVTLVSGTTNYLTPGNQVLLLEAGPYSGPQIVDTVTGTGFTFSTSLVGTASSALLVGHTVQVDEQLAWQDTQSDSTVFTTSARWIPIESPDDSYTLTPKTHVRYFDSNQYANQPFLRSTMVVDNMYFTNADDEVYKLDGTNNYRAGLIPWQPGVFLTQETSGATIVTDLRTLSYSAIVAGEGKLTVTAANQQTIPVGGSVRLTGSAQTYTVTSFTDDGTNFYVRVDRALDSLVSTSGSINEIGTYRYYYRLNAVDSNNNLIASAVTGYQDHVMELTGNAAVQHKIVGLPAWDVYDYDRLEVQIYRTQMNTQAPFYLITTLPMNFNNSTGYIQFRDSFADVDLTQLDIVNTALKGTELGTAWTDPLRAKYVTSIGNQLVLGNVRDYSQLDLQIVADATLDNSTLDGGKLLFRRDNTASGTTTDMLSRVTYQYVDGPTGTPGGITTNTNSFTVTGIVEAVTAGSWIYLTYSTNALTGRDLTYSGWWQINSVTGAGPYDATITFTGTTAPSTVPDRYVLASNPLDVPVLLGVDGSLGMVNGDSFDTFDVYRRLALAINTTMRQTDVSITSMSGFTPWLTARSGNDTPPAGRILIRQPRADATTMEIVPSFVNYSLFINSVRRATGEQVSASTREYPSRILVSYPNYPEIFDNPTSILDTNSDSAIDINSADGQEITGIIPFFGEAAFTAAQQSAILVVFKTNSIYLVDINQKKQGLNPVQRIETQGLGCTAPYSISVTKSGVMFANESGIYRLRQDQSIEYIGRFMERNWVERVDLNALSMIQGHHYGLGRMYKISVPITSTAGDNGYIENSEVYTYNHTSEDFGPATYGAMTRGAWSRYDNHPATGWANLGSNAYFSSSTGRVFQVRNLDSLDDYRDDSSAVDFRMDLRPNDFGNSGIRKIVDSVVVHYRIISTSNSTSLQYAVDMEEEFDSTTAVILKKPSSTNGMSDTVNKSVITIRHNLARRRCSYMQLRIENSAIDDTVEVAGVDFRIGGLSDKGITQASQT